jgi:hypothetical protein
MVIWGFKDEVMFKELMNDFSAGAGNKQKCLEEYLEPSVYDVMQFNIRPHSMEIVVIYRGDRNCARNSNY